MCLTDGRRTYPPERCTKSSTRPLSRRGRARAPEQRAASERALGGLSTVRLPRKVCSARALGLQLVGARESDGSSAQAP